ncbi:MAG: hypothetical protein FWC16_11420 [Defluviitaleaceae bacterium]|nr:hypothetical protein [Defluviitaleaceae bacterium]MCL2275528.1 hypothetical protein [Defluviitaleaceae bacterium]
MADFKCAVCGSMVTVSDVGYCAVCDWMQDTVQEHEPDYRGGANKITLNEARARWSLQISTSQTPIRQPSYEAEKIAV